MKLPMVDEVRAARAAAAEAHAAIQAVAIAEAALRGVELVAARRSPDDTLPGASELTGLAETWPALARVAEPEGSVVTIADRRGRLQYALQVLRPIAAAAAARQATLHLLRQRQAEELQGPKHRRLLGALRKRATELAEIDRELTPAEAELVPLDVVGRMLGTWIPRARTDERREVLLGHLASGLAPLLADLAKEVRGAPGPSSDLAAWEALAGRVEARRRRVERRVLQLRARRARTEAWIEERLG